MAPNSSAASHMKPCRENNNRCWDRLQIVRACVCVQIQTGRRSSYSVVAEPGDVAFIAGVEQNGSPRFLPVFVSDEVALLEGPILQEAKMINLWQKETVKMEKINM